VPAVFCPRCRDEFRPGFTRCAACDVDLVEQLPHERGALLSAAAVAAVPTRSHGPVRLSDYCGFLSLDEAREARDLLRTHGIASEIVLREALDADPEGPFAEEAWLRVDVARLNEVRRILPEPEVGGDEG